MPPFDHFMFRAAAVAFLASAAPVASFVAPAEAQIAVSITAPLAPPALPVYVQPPVPAAGYIWTPGYWAWNAAGYYWVPGAWILPPRVGFLWTPGYWGWSSGVYAFRAGYWGPTVGFYGGINYGYGYGGAGFSGGYWSNGAFNYNTAVANVSNTHIGNTYNAPVTINKTVNVTRVSYNGGQGGVAATPTPAEKAYAGQQHVAPTPAQVQHQQVASKTPALAYANNKGAPPIGATAHPGVFKGAGVTRAMDLAHPTAAGSRNAGLQPAAKAAPGAQHAGPSGQAPGHQGETNAPHPGQAAAQGQTGPGPHPGPGSAPGPHPGSEFRPGPHAGPQFAAGPQPGFRPGPHPGPRPGPHPGPHPGGGPRRL